MQEIKEVPLRRLHCKQSACFMVFSVRPIYRHLATSGHPENGSKLNFAMEPSRLLAVELWLSFLYASYNGAMVVYLTELMPPLVRTSAFSIAYSLAAAIFV